MPVDGDEGLKPTHLAHCFCRSAAGKDDCAGVGAKTTQTVAAFGADDPDDWIRAPICRSDYGRTLSIGGRAPGRSECWRGACSNLDDCEVAAGSARAPDARPLKSDERRIVCREIRRRSADGTA